MDSVFANTILTIAHGVWSRTIRHLEVSDSKRKTASPILRDMTKL